LNLMERISNSQNPGYESEINALISSLSVESLKLIPDVIKQVFSMPGLWRAKASVVNKLPEIGDQIDQSDIPGDGVCDIAHALVLAGHSTSQAWIHKMIKLLDDQNYGCSVALKFANLCKSATWQHSVTSFLFRQRVWSIVYPILSSEASKQEKINHLSALLSLLPQVPKPLLEGKLSSLLPHLVRGLKLEAAQESALISLSNILITQPSLISSYIREIVDGCLLLTRKPTPLNLRIKSLVCLKYIGMITSPDTIALSSSVTHDLQPAIQDHKRVVREAAAIARNRWYLVSQP